MPHDLLANRLADAAAKLGPAATVENGALVYHLGRAGSADDKTYVYFIGGDVGCIKIGYSNFPDLRLQQLQVASPIDLRILARLPGDFELERELQHRFAACRVRGEWFERTPELLAFIEWLNEPEAQ